jgi:hypothetical protein
VLRLFIASFRLALRTTHQKTTGREERKRHRLAFGER